MESVTEMTQLCCPFPDVIWFNICDLDHETVQFGFLPELLSPTSNLSFFGLVTQILPHFLRNLCEVTFEPTLSL